MEDWINGAMDNIDPEKAQIPILLGEQMAQEMLSMINRHNNTLMVLPENDYQIAAYAYINKVLEVMPKQDSNFLDHFVPGFKTIIDSFSDVEE